MLAPIASNAASPARDRDDPLFPPVTTQFERFRSTSFGQRSSRTRAIQGGRSDILATPRARPGWCARAVAGARPTEARTARPRLRLDIPELRSGGLPRRWMQRKMHVWLSMHERFVELVFAE